MISYNFSIDKIQNPIENSCFGICPYCKTINEKFSIQKDMCYLCKKNKLLFKTYKIGVLNFKSFIFWYFKNNSFDRSMSRLVDLELELNNIVKSNIYFEYSEYNLCWYVKFNKKNTNKNLKSILKLIKYIKNFYEYELKNSKASISNNLQCLFNKNEKIFSITEDIFSSDCGEITAAIMNRDFFITFLNQNLNFIEK
jgi:hypothetical protein